MQLHFCHGLIASWKKHFLSRNIYTPSTILWRKILFHFLSDVWIQRKERGFALQIIFFLLFIACFKHFYIKKKRRISVWMMDTNKLLTFLHFSFMLVKPERQLNYFCAFTLWRKTFFSPSASFDFLLASFGHLVSFSQAYAKTLPGSLNETGGYIFWKFIVSQQFAGNIIIYYEKINFYFNFFQRGSVESVVQK